MMCSERPGAFYNRYHFPITFPSQEARDLIADYLHKRKIDTIRYLDDIVDIAVSGLDTLAAAGWQKAFQKECS